MTHVADRSILVVEDSDEDWETACDAGAAAGVRSCLHRALDATECLAWLHQRLGANAVSSEAPVLVLVDLNLPGVDGRTLLASIKADVSLRAVPVVVLSTSSSQRDIASCYDAGANAYHVKPLRYPDHLRELASIFNYWLGLNRPPRAGAICE